MSIKFTIQHLWGLVLPCCDARQVHQMADEIAQQCQAGIWQRICHRMSSMSASEIRGYAMAHAVGFVESEVDRTLCRHGRNSTLRSRVIDTAVQKIVSLVIHDAFIAASSANAQMIAA
jgi:hypothetical protein